ncbi:MAG: mechanosensitive ion channel [Desulfobacteraceae bacterium]|nr:mechanosensitive ion channel [Desulfobacteraceae bacterium]
MIIGLALQINIANIFSGIVINIERPFRIGDWVKIGNFPEGKIVDINWRTTKIQTRDDTMLSIPNSQASEAQVENFSFPNAGYWQYFTLHVDPIHPPDRVKKILLDAALSSKFVAKDPAPFTRFLGLTAGITSQSQSYAANYLICIFVPDYGKKFAYNEDVWMNLWKHLRRAGIRVVLPRQETHFFLEGVKRKPERIGKTLMMLQELEIFRPFSYRSQNLSQQKSPSASLYVRRDHCSAGR